MKRIVGLLCLGILGGCASSGGNQDSPWMMGGTAQRIEPCSTLSREHELAINLARDMASEGRLHAALANLEGLPNDLPEARLNKARILRSIGRQDEARKLYESLLKTCLVAQARHGLGQLAAAQGDNPQALENLRIAVRMAPTEDQVRNDLGVVYMNLRQVEEARFEFVTAMELNTSNRLPAQNLVSLLIYQDNWKQASEVVSRMGLKPEEVRSAEARARRLRQEDGARVVDTQRRVPAPVPAAPAPTQSKPQVRQAAPQVAPAVPSQPVVAPAPVVQPRPAVAPSQPVVRQAAPQPQPQPQPQPPRPVQQVQPKPAPVTPVVRQAPAASSSRVVVTRQPVAQPAQALQPSSGGVQQVQALPGRGEPIIPFNTQGVLRVTPAASTQAQPIVPVTGYETAD